ncbi:chemotaxis protein CheA [Motilimonas sp. 1_MG-2023]|uniref:chemotaxis protein CheA n=1 Tax=Motilimonas sp. 1_MG-2023 TaxID=3062672 RepID=UPI0026E27171|nr:chemotaxis protein CheA [Motilimonas sp. 1_MG-2023]MDO6524070.1 chemotaxis protein CheA [Motilimonas sp. 1_MG-2023]
MSMDMSQFHGVFIEESHEHLDEMEHLLLALDPSSPDVEELNSIFRAAHSIKGGSGMFAFDALITVTHVMENIFDRARQGKFQFSARVIDGLLSAVDTLRTLLKSYTDATEPDWALVNTATADLELILDPSSEPAVDTKEQAYGFFVSVGAESSSSESSEGSTEASVKVGERDDEGFGFFEPLVSTSEAPMETGGEGSNEVTENGDDEGFGFFEPLPGPATAELDQVDDEGFGFFAPSGQSDNQVYADEKGFPVSDGVSEEAITPATGLMDKPRPAAAKLAVTGSGKADSKAKPESTEASSIRVDIVKIDSLVNLVGELVITQSMLNLIGDELTGPTVERLHSALSELERNTRELQEGIMSIRMLPMSFVFNRFPRVVRDLSKKLNKKVDLQIEGGQTEIDKGLIERLVDPLTHLVRNSLDHGIELPDVRAARGKPETGRLTLKAEQKGGNILISVLDDGGGLDRDRILVKAYENNIDVVENPTDQQVWQLIMSAGFSTAAEVTDVSGRGVGMDVVKRNIESMGGRLEIESEAGLGSSFQIRLPLTLAILDGMSIAVGGQMFIIPLVNIIESVQPDKPQLKCIGNQKVLDLRNAYWPIVRLHQVMEVEPKSEDPCEGILVLIETSKTRFALLVDELIGQQQVVIKSLEQHYRRVPGVAGATIMGDGSVALILDAESLALRVEESVAVRSGNE